MRKLLMAVMLIGSLELPAAAQTHLEDTATTVISNRGQHATYPYANVRDDLIDVPGNDPFKMWLENTDDGIQGDGWLEFQWDSPVHIEYVAVHAHYYDIKTYSVETWNGSSYVVHNTLTDEPLVLYRMDEHRNGDMSGPDFPAATTRLRINVAEMWTPSQGLRISEVEILDQNLLPEVNVDPVALDFTEFSGYEVNIQAGETTKTQQITVENTGDAQLRVDDLVISGANAAAFSVDPGDYPFGGQALQDRMPINHIAPGEAKVLNVRFHPNVGSNTFGMIGLLAIENNDQTVNVALEGDAVPAELSDFLLE
ncbi:MAG TPA: hypothetical protein PLG73_03840 [Candidatus Sumerlaeota bacterium]|nr:hypothetical protein [Candidatus Sumerlaeota bacterium]